MTRPTSGRHAHARLARAGAAVVLAAAVAVGAAAAPSAAAEKKLTHATGSRATFIHRLPLLDTEKKPVRIADDPVLPFSYRTTCDKCHAYAEVRTGWHFNAADPSVDPGRPGQPWFWCDPKTGTQIPLSYRAWPNTWRPADLG
ncbi:MAG: hypothetical protein IMZ66_12720, partial [Planctomycetes bacterium]|nr:hypothetical protein [Planctomycetota bacterium]